MSSLDEPIKTYSSILKYINGYGIIENHKDKHVIYSYKLAEEDNYKLNKDLVCITSVDEPIKKEFEQEQTLGFILHETESFFQKQFLADCGFYLTEKLNDSNDYRIYFFTSCYPVIYEKIVNEQELIKGFVGFFKKHNSHMVDIFTQIKNDFDNQRGKYFKEPNNLKYLSDREDFFATLNALDVLKKDVILTDNEWIILNSYNYGSIHDIDMNHIFNISKEEMKNRFNQITHKILK